MSSPIHPYIRTRVDMKGCHPWLLIGRETPTLGKSASPLAKSGSTRSWPGTKRLPEPREPRGA